MLFETNHVDSEGGTYIVVVLSTEDGTVDVLLLSTEDGTVDVLLLSTEINECEEWIVRVSTQAVCLFGQFISAQKLHHCTIDGERQLPSVQVD